MQVYQYNCVIQTNFRITIVAQLTTAVNRNHSKPSNYHARIAITCYVQAASQLAQYDTSSSLFQYTFAMTLICSLINRLTNPSGSTNNPCSSDILCLLNSTFCHSTPHLSSWSTIHTCLPADCSTNVHPGSNNPLVRISGSARDRTSACSTAISCSWSHRCLGLSAGCRGLVRCLQLLKSREKVLRQRK
jgi:hypothetical protein